MVMNEWNISVNVPLLTVRSATWHGLHWQIIELEYTAGRAFSCLKVLTKHWLVRFKKKTEDNAKNMHTE